MKFELPRAGRQESWGAHAPSRADFGALAKIFSQPIGTARGKVGDHEGVIASTRGACAPRRTR